MEYPKLPKDFKEKWTAALRSPRYHQGKGALCDRGKYCCLGVAAAECGVPTESLYSRGFINSFKVFDAVPDVLRGARNNPVVSELIKMNDSGKTFNQIADWIEENL